MSKTVYKGNDITGKEIRVTRFYAGASVGPCVQITILKGFPLTYVQIPISELYVILKAVEDGKEVDE
jgi:hypothetical protein